jgi:methyl-accepting chemotaxis protein
LITEEFAELQPYINQLITNSQATRMHLADSDRKIIASSQPSELGNTLSSLADRQQHKWLVREIHNATGLLGVLAIEFSNRELEDTYREARDFGISIALVGMLIIAAVGILVGVFLTRRLETITRAAALLSEGDLSVRTDLDQQDELGSLARTFDQMAHNLQLNEESLSQTLALL